MSPTSQRPAAIASSTSTSEPRICGSLAIQERSSALSPGLAVLGDPVGDQRLVVLVVRRAQAEAALEARVAEVLVRADRLRGNALGRAHRRPDARADPPPGAIRVVQLVRAPARAAARVSTGSRRPACSARHRFARSVVTSRSASVRVALAAQALEQLGRGAAAQLDLEPGLLLERLEGLLVAVLGAAVVDDDVGRAAQRHGGGGEHGDDEHHARRPRCPAASWSSALG